MEVFYTSPELITSESIIIQDDEFRHITRVLRKQVGDSITVVDGIGNKYTATVSEIGKRALTCSITRKVTEGSARMLSCTLAIALLKNASRYDWIIEKGTELGVTRFVPLKTERTIARSGRVDRWQHIAIAAMKQSERAYLPRIQSVSTIEDFLNIRTADDLNILPHEKVGEPTLKKFLIGAAGSRSATVCIGPEGGFTDDEVALFERNDFYVVSLGRHRLRSETAAIAAAVMVLDID